MGNLFLLPLYSDAQSSVSPLLHHIIPLTNTLFLSFFQLLMVHIPTGEESHHIEPEQKETRSVSYHSIFLVRLFILPFSPKFTWNDFSGSITTQHLESKLLKSFPAVTFPIEHHTYLSDMCNSFNFKHLTAWKIQAKTNHKTNPQNPTPTFICFPWLLDWQLCETHRKKGLKQSLKQMFIHTVMTYTYVYT